MKLDTLDGEFKITVGIMDEGVGSLKNLPASLRWHGNTVYIPVNLDTYEWVKQHIRPNHWSTEAAGVMRQFSQTLESTLDYADHVSTPTHTFAFKTQPWDHQVELFERAKDLEYHAFFMEQGTGKSKCAIDKTAYLYASGKIDGMLVVAWPSSVPPNWIKKELPEHMPDWVETVNCNWQAKLEGRKWYREQELYPVMEPQDPSNPKLFVFTMNAEALSTRKGVEYARKFLSAHKCHFIVDESTAFAESKSSRTKALLKLRKLAPYRTIMTGTPVPNGPLKIYAPFYFLDPSILGFNSFYGFRNHHADMRPLYGKKDGRGRPIQIVSGYKNMEELNRKISPHMYRVLKKDCLDLPEKLPPVTYHCEMTPKQRKLYEQVKEEVLISIKDEAMTMDSALKRMLRLQQIACGFFVPDDAVGGTEVTGQAIEDKNPRIQTMLDIIEEAGPHKKMGIWGNFRYNFVEMYEAISKAYGKDKVAWFDGDYELVKRFQEGELMWMLSHPRVGGYGLTWTAAHHCLYFSNTFSLEYRLQSEDRFHRGGQTEPVWYGDIMAPNTIDEKIVAAQQEKIRIADMVLNGGPESILS